MTDGGIVVRRATSAADLEAVRELFRGFVVWQRERNADHVDLIDRYFDPDAWEAELAGLPGDYGPPGGVLLVAEVDGVVAGCVGLRRLDDQACEMKRMFVPAQMQGRGIGRALGERIVAAAREAGYSTMWLDTSIHQPEALGLYRRLGFVEVAPRYELPADMEGWLVFRRLDL